MLDEYIEYIVAIAPIIIGHVIIPPISHYIGTEKYPPALDFLYNFKPLAIRSLKDLESLMYKSSLPLDSIQIITHMFVHSDTSHLLNNLDAILYSAYPVYREFGMRGLYTTFLLGGISAVIPSPLYDIQKDGNVSKLEKLVSLQHSPISTIVPKSVLSWFDKPLKEVAKGVGNAYYKITTFYMCGSSGGACALIGCDLILVIRDSFKLITKAYKSYQINNNNNRNNNRDEHRLSNREKYLLLQYGLCTIKTLSYFTKELNMVYGNGTTGVLFDTINHAAHLQGSLFGMAFGLVFGVAVPYIQRNRLILL